MILLLLRLLPLTAHGSHQPNGLLISQIYRHHYAGAARARAPVACLIVDDEDDKQLLGGIRVRYATAAAADEKQFSTPQIFVVSQSRRRSVGGSGTSSVATIGSLLSLRWPPNVARPDFIANNSCCRCQLPLVAVALGGSILSDLTAPADIAHRRIMGNQVVKANFERAHKPSMVDLDCPTGSGRRGRRGRRGRSGRRWWRLKVSPFGLRWRKMDEVPAAGPEIQQQPTTNTVPGIII